MERLTVSSPLSVPLREAIRTFASKLEAYRGGGSSVASLLKIAADKDAGAPTAPVEHRPVQRGFVGNVAILTELKRFASLLPAAPADEDGGEPTGPDQFPLRPDSPLLKEHKLLTDLYVEWDSFPNYSDRLLSRSKVGGKILALPAEQKGRVLLALGERMFHGQRAPRDPFVEVWSYGDRIVQFLLDDGVSFNRPLLFEAVLLLAMVRERFQTECSTAATGRLLDAAEGYASAEPLSEPERYVLSLLRVAMIEGKLLGSDEGALKRLSRLVGDGVEVVLSPSADWAEHLHAAAASAEPARRKAMLDLLRHCVTASSGKPAAKWLKSAAPLVQSFGGEKLAATLRTAFGLFAAERADPVWKSVLRRYGNEAMPERNALAMKGLLWVAPLVADKQLTRVIRDVAVSAYRKVPGIGPRAVSVGNAAIYALREIATEAAIGQLAVLKARVKFGTAQKEIEKAFTAAADALGLPRDQIEEMGVPTYGLEEVGLRREQFGEFTAELRVDGRDASLRWLKADGKELKSVPAKVKAEHKDELKELQASVKDISGMLPAQAERLDAMFLGQKTWPVAAWRERYLDHPLVGTISRRLIWQVRLAGGEARSGMWLDGAMVAADDQPIDLPESAEVRFWHPIDRPTDEVLAWRHWLQRYEVRQPFKQAHREVYLLTDAERNTRTYSNRFAGHVLRQHQFNALCAARGWKNKLRLLVDDSYPPATRELPQWGLRAEYWVEGAGDQYGDDTNDSGVYLRLVTDQVRFYRTGAAVNYVHASGGRYESAAAGAGEDNINEPLPLDQVPPLVLSEVLRDVDLFVGVASVGNDPAWQDGGPEGRYRTYWQTYSFGELSQTAQTRKAVLETLLPRLTKLKDKWTLTDRFLVIRGSLRTYKIHLGSGNILMEPNDQYLCIVPARGAAAADQAAGFFLPFEGDGTMSVILSKAFLLADDGKIKDATILSQIGGR